MLTTTLSRTESPSTTVAQPATPTVPHDAPVRLDLYAPIHKALRLFMNDTLARVGRFDIDDAAECAATLAQVEQLLEFCARHLAHENEFMHPAIEARAGGVAARAAADHGEHLIAIAELAAEARLLASMTGAAARALLALRLYRHLALFVADNLQHMHIEETAHNQALWAHYRDDELAALHGALLASIGDAEMAQVLRWMLPALAPAERAEMLGGMQAQMPPEAFRGVLGIARERLDDTAWAKLCRALGLPVAAGLCGA